MFQNSKLDEEAIENFKKVLTSEQIFAMAKSPFHHDGRLVLVDLVTESHRISTILLDGCMKNYAKPLNLCFQDLSPPNLNDKKMELGFIMTTGKISKSLFGPTRLFVRPFIR